MRDLNQAVRKLRKQTDDALHQRRAMNAGAKVEVDYFALLDLINYFDETRDAAERVARARDLMENVMFSVTPRKT